MSGGRRGRPSYDDYMKRASEVLRYDVFALDECTSLAQLPGVQAMQRKLKHAVLPTGAALRKLIDIAVEDIEKTAASSDDVTMQRLLQFLKIWYHQRGTVTQAAKAMSLSRSYVAHTIQRKAVDLITRRFLELAWETLPISA